MNYIQIYKLLILKRKQNILNKKDQYCEIHHIVPVCLNGSNDFTNLVALTAKEHFVAHLLLHKIYPNNDKLAQAVMMMQVKNGNLKRNRTLITGKIYEQLKLLTSKFLSDINSGKNNPMFGKMWIVNYDLHKNMQIMKNDKIPNGWVKGRCLNFDEYERKKQKTLNLKIAKKLYLDLLPWYCKNFEMYGYEWLHKNGYPYSDLCFIRHCKKYLDNFKTQRGKKRNRIIAKLD